MGFRLAELFVDITTNDKQALTGIGRVQGAFAGLGSKLLALGGAIGGGMFLKNAIDGASNLAETISKTQQVFGPASDVVLGFADDVASKYGLVKQPMLDAAAVFGLMGKGAGMANDQAATFSTTMAMLAADASSFYNVPLDVALEKIRSGLSGEAEPLRAFGVFLSDAAMKAKAAQMGLVGLNDELSEGQKITVRAALIQEQLGTANGDLARTIGGTANQQRKLMGDLTNATNEFGTAIMPVWNGVLMAASNALQGINGWLASSAEGVTSWATVIGEWLSAVGIVFRNWDLSIQIVAITFGQHMTNIQEWVGWAFGVLGQYVNWFADNYPSVIDTTLKFCYSIFQNVFTNIVNLVRAAWDFITNPGSEFKFEFKGLLDGFESSMAALPEIAAPHLSNFQDQIDGLTMQMSDAEAARASAAGASAPKNLIPGVGTGDAAASTEKTRTTTLEGFAKNLMEAGFGKDKALKAAETTATGVTKLVELGKQTNPMSAKDIFAMAAP
jgi:hypothetical protein